MPVGFDRVSNFAYVTSGLAYRVFAEDEDRSGVVVVNGVTSGPLLTESDELLLTESGLEILVE